MRLRTVAINIESPFESAFRIARALLPQVCLANSQMQVRQAWIGLLRLEKRSQGVIHVAFLEVDDPHEQVSPRPRPGGRVGRLGNDAWRRHFPAIRLRRPILRSRWRR